MDIWRLGLVQRPLCTILSDGFGNAPVQWIESARPFSFLADPFGFWRDERLHVFAEAYDYRSRIGHIEVLTFDRDLVLLNRRPCLKERWHLSYPFVFANQGDVWMLPEAHRSGKLTLYRSSDFPHAWEAKTELDLPELTVDATPLFHQGLWWLFYSPADHAGPPKLHAVFTRSLSDRWTPHPMNPLFEGSIGSRPGGTPVIDGDCVILPVQEMVRSYGSGMRMLYLRGLTAERVEVALGESLRPPTSASPYNEGFHTVSGAGNVTLIDVKRVERSIRRLPIDVLGRGRRAARKWSLR